MEASTTTTILPPRFEPTADVLTYAQQAVVEQLARGLGTRQIAERLGNSPRTIYIHIHDIHRKLGTKNRTQIVLWAVRHGFGTGRSILAMLSDKSA